MILGHGRDACVYSAPLQPCRVVRARTWISIMHYRGFVLCHTSDDRPSMTNHLTHVCGIWLLFGTGTSELAPMLTLGALKRLQKWYGECS